VRGALGGGVKKDIMGLFYWAGLIKFFLPIAICITDNGSSLQQIHVYL
jgi:hypothetical protein